MNWPEFAIDSAAPPGIALLVLLAAYALGCVSTGYYLVRWRTGQDVRATGTGVTGATNVSRALGKTGFALTLLLDAGKGMLASGLASWAQFDLWLRWLVVLAVVAGNIWPAQLGFRGGKGIATLLGALLVLDWRILLIVAALAPLTLLVFRRFVIAGLCALVFTPPVLIWLQAPVAHAAGMSGLVLIILWAHRQNLRDWLNQRSARHARHAATATSRNS
jgi:glycerol-3-phosphate acyltransferase PlsY